MEKRYEKPDFIIEEIEFEEIINTSTLESALKKNDDNIFDWYN